MSADPTGPVTRPKERRVNEPLTDEALRHALALLPPGIRIEEAIAQLGIAAYSVAFAKTASPRLQAVSEQIGKNPVAAGLNHLLNSILQKAVLDTAATFDQTGEGTSSLATALNLITRRLKASPSTPERKAALALADGIRKRAVQNRTPELEYVRYMRNKWAAHVTYDLVVDQWEPGASIDFRMLDTALQQMQIHFQELATLTEQVSALEGLEHDGRLLDNDTYRFGLGWEGFSSKALLIMASHGENSAKLLLGRIEPELKSVKD